MEYYMFFDDKKMPIAVFLSETQEKAIRLFSILYKMGWDYYQSLGFSVSKEKDVPTSEWYRIHAEYKRLQKEKNGKV